MSKKTQLAESEPVEPLLHVLRGERIILDADLARIYGVSTKRLNEQVKRNAQRFPADFAFRLTNGEAIELLRPRSQTATLKRGQNIKCLPHAFTERGAIHGDPGSPAPAGAEAAADRFPRRQQ